MSAATFFKLPVFYYVDSVTLDNFSIDFNEGGPELNATLATGDYTITELTDVLEAALNQAGALTYTVTFNRATRLMTVSATGTFSLLVATGTNIGSEGFTLFGFTGADRTGASTYTGNIAVGSEYSPQFPLQDYTDAEDFQKAISPSVNKSASGDVEVVRFGTEKFYEFNITFITNIDQGNAGPIVTNLSGVSEARLFLRFCVTKRKLELMLDKTDRATFETVLLEKTTEEKDGTGYRLKELYSRGIPGYFETGVLTFRLIE